MKEYIVELTTNDVLALFYTSGLCELGDLSPYSMLFGPLDDIVSKDYPYQRNVNISDVYDEIETSHIFKCDYKL